MKQNFEQITLPMMIRWWTKKNSIHDKGGSFDVQLYLRICAVKNSMYIPNNKK